MPQRWVVEDSLAQRFAIRRIRDLRSFQGCKNKPWSFGSLALRQKNRNTIWKSNHAIRPQKNHRFRIYTRDAIARKRCGQAARKPGNSCNPSGKKTVTSSDWIPAVAGIQLYREVFEVSEFIVTLIAVSKTSRYNPFALRCSSITRSDRAKRILYFQFLLSYLTLSFLFFLLSLVSSLSS